ncbi:MAG TPA: ribonuclease P protein subunit [Nitrososphaerales archaeon]|jgi:RNase P/RNase MRP subunit p29|nr:ribonuclease P protein subunit [Nitrososphaerales archaeon]
MTFIIGEDVRVAAARDAVLLGLRGKVVLETMHTLTIRTDSKRKVTLPKDGSALQLSDGQIILGDDLKGRLEDRIAYIGRTARRGARRSR